MKVKRVAVLGAGNGGITAAADLKLRGFEVSLFELPQFSRNIDLLRERKGEVVLKEPGWRPKGDNRSAYQRHTGSSCRRPGRFGHCPLPVG